MQAQWGKAIAFRDCFKGAGADDRNRERLKGWRTTSSEFLPIEPATMGSRISPPLVGW